MSVSDRRVSYEPHDWPNFNVRVTVGRSDMSRFTEGIWQGSFTVNNKRAVRTLKPSSEQKKCFEKLANQKRRHMPLPFYGIRTRSCALIRRRSIQKV